jgi:hypothetical protein
MKAAIMTTSKKPTHHPSLPFPPGVDTLHREGNWLWIPLRKECAASYLHPGCR